MSVIEIAAFWVVFVGFVGWFALQMHTRYRLVMAGANNFSLDELPARVRRFVGEVVFQSKTIRAKPWVGTAHLLVFWGFCAFGLYTMVEFLHGLGIVDLTGTRPFHWYKTALVPFCRRRAVGHRVPGDPPRHRAPAGAGRPRLEGVDPHRLLHRDADGHVPARVLRVRSRRRPPARPSASTGGCTWW